MQTFSTDTPVFTLGDRVLHAEWAFGTVVELPDGKIKVRLDNGQEVETPLDGWEQAYVLPNPVIPLEDMTDEQLDAELERFKNMRQIVPKRRATSRAGASHAAMPVVDINELKAQAAADPAVKALLQQIGILPKEEVIP